MCFAPTEKIWSILILSPRQEINITHLLYQLLEKLSPLRPYFHYKNK